jgi:hypothetical protein
MKKLFVMMAKQNFSDRDLMISLFLLLAVTLLKISKEIASNLDDFYRISYTF